MSNIEKILKKTESIKPLDHQVTKLTEDTEKLEEGFFQNLIAGISNLFGGYKKTQATALQNVKGLIGQIDAEKKQNCTAAMQVSQALDSLKQVPFNSQVIQGLQPTITNGDSISQDFGGDWVADASQLVSKNANFWKTIGTQYKSAKEVAYLIACIGDSKAFGLGSLNSKVKSGFSKDQNGGTARNVCDNLVRALSSKTAGPKGLFSGFNTQTDLKSWMCSLLAEYNMIYDQKYKNSGLTAFLKDYSEGKVPSFDAEMANMDPAAQMARVNAIVRMLITAGADFSSLIPATQVGAQ